jgi:isopentenyl diphosphate isomerase/L-lactate dehydrogenase-like FMN-dependent dehydrogenase
MGASQELLERAQGAGYTAIVITVDQQASFYERSQHDRNLGGRTGGAGRGIGRAGGAATAARQGGAGRANDPEALGTATIGRGAAVPGAAAVGAPAAGPALRGAAAYRVGAGRLWYTWEYMDQVRKFIKTPVIIKGIVTAEDARICVERGFDGIVVSNHGGRSMDYGPSTLEVLPEIVAAVNGKIPVMIDSGFRRGGDVLKALALGADAIWLGRASRWALGAFGPAGVQRLLTDIIFKELVDAAAYAGKTTLGQIDSTIVKQNWP